MRAPVYRSIDTGDRFLGLSWPSEVGALLLVFVFANRQLTGLSFLLVMAVVYGGLRLSSHGKPPGYRVAFLFFHRRRLLHGGRFSAAARAAPQRPLPAATYAIRDVPVSESEVLQ